jgi:hypothetical protein
MQPLSSSVLKRLRLAEARQRRETLARGLPAEKVDVEALWEAQAGICGCGCGQALDVETKWDWANPPPLYAVIAHVLARGSHGEHTSENVALWAYLCNARAGHRETSEAASVKRFAVVKGREKSGSIQSRGFSKQKTTWPKRAFPKKP